METRHAKERGPLGRKTHTEENGYLSGWTVDFLVLGILVFYIPVMNALDNVMGELCLVE